MDSIKYSLDEILKRAGLRLWVMVDRLDELFPRQEAVGTEPLRGLLRSMREFSSRRIILNSSFVTTYSPRSARGDSPP